MLQLILLYSKSDGAKESVQSLICSWPMCYLSMSDFMPKSLLVDAHVLESIIMKSLLKLKPNCKMKKIDFSGENFSRMSYSHNYMHALY